MINATGHIWLRINYLHSIYWYPSNPDIVQIGCQCRTFKQWAKLSDRYGLRKGYTVKDVAKVRKVLKRIEEIRDAIK